MDNKRIDTYIEAKWQQNTARFAVECKALSTPKAFQDGVNLLKSFSLPNDYLPMLFMPFLNERQLQELEREGLSGIDLCGNGVVVVPGKFAVFRSGGKNRFPSSALIKNIYRKNSSMVGRVFLLCAGYETVQEIRTKINQRNLLVNRWDKKPMSLSTVSKALKTLEDDLIVTREGTIRLLQPDKLLEKLRENYDPPAVKERVRLKISEESGMVWK
ncbi:MAG: winged helix-turn-helix domain-containing protein, partial [bacterium]|nr:winged helix-turn-helix domain-containing protein [bacterium]